MRWLLTVPDSVDRDALARAMTVAGGSLDQDQPVPLDDDELVYFAEGPRDLPTRLGDQDAPVHKVSPQSEPQPY